MGGYSLKRSIRIQSIFERGPQLCLQLGQQSDGILRVGEKEKAACENTLGNESLIDFHASYTESVAENVM